MIIPHCSKCGDLMKGQNELKKKTKEISWEWVCLKCEPFAYKRSLEYGVVFRGK